MPNLLAWSGIIFSMRTSPVLSFSLHSSLSRPHLRRINGVYQSIRQFLAEKQSDGLGMSKTSLFSSLLE
jgi:hypothetical protein